MYFKLLFIEKAPNRGLFLNVLYNIKFQSLKNYFYGVLMVYGWPIRLLRVLWIASVIVSLVQADEESSNLYELVVVMIGFFILWIIAFLIPLQYILLGSINPKVLFNKWKSRCLKSPLLGAFLLNFFLLYNGHRKCIYKA